MLMTSGPCFQVKVIELYRPSDGYFGFQISPTIQDSKLRVFISGFGHGLTDKLFTGLIAVGANSNILHNSNTISKSILKETFLILTATF